MGSGELPRLRQASAVPYRMRDGEAEYLLITSQKGNWIFPKGIIDPGETPEETALKEAREEGGVRGRIRGGLIAHYEDEKWGCPCEISVYLMEVEDEESLWLESAERERAWFPYEEARRLLEKKKLRKVLERARASLPPLAARRSPPGGSSGPGT